MPSFDLSPAAASAFSLVLLGTGGGRGFATAAFPPAPLLEEGGVLYAGAAAGTARR